MEDTRNCLREGDSLQHLRYLSFLAVGGAFGATARYILEGWVTTGRSAFPSGTLAVNLSGSLLLGFFYTLAIDRYNLPPEWRLAVAIGFLGAYTTFSTLSYETYKLLEDGAFLIAALNMFLSVAGGLAAIYAGTVAARLI